LGVAASAGGDTIAGVVMATGLGMAASTGVGEG
jgi:hypothetical protein